MSSSDDRAQISGNRRRSQKNEVGIGSGAVRRTGATGQIDLGFSPELQDIQLDADFEEVATPKKDNINLGFQSLDLDFGFDNFDKRRGKQRKTFF